MLCAGLLEGCLVVSEVVVLVKDSRGDMGMAEPSGGSAVAISGNKEVRLKLER